MYSLRFHTYVDVCLDCSSSPSSSSSTVLSQDVELGSFQAVPRNESNAFDETSQIEQEILQATMEESLLLNKDGAMEHTRSNNAVDVRTAARDAALRRASSSNRNNKAVKGNGFLLGEFGGSIVDNVDKDVKNDDSKNADDSNTYSSRNSREALI